MINPKEIENKLKEVIEEKIEGYRLKKRRKELKDRDIPYFLQKEDIKVGYVPYDKLEDVTPIINIRRFKGKNTIEENNMKIRVLIQLYDLDEDTGYDSMINIIRMIQKSVLEKGLLTGIVNDGTEKRKYEIDPTAEWEISEEQTYGYSLGAVIFTIKEFKDYRIDQDDWINGVIKEED